MEDFLFKSPTKIIYGIGKSLHLNEIIKELGGSKVLVVTDKVLENTDSFKKLTEALSLNGINYGIYSDTMPEPPIEVVDAAAEMMRKEDYDLIVAVGGGSPIDTSKAMAMLKTNEGSARDYMFGGGKTVTNLPIPLICVPTTAGSGSEVTAASVISDNQNQIKLSITSELIMPRVAVVDPLMQEGMPLSVTASTGMDALTHAIESYTSIESNPVSQMYSLTAMKMIAENIRTAAFHPHDLEARGQMALASVLAAVSFVNGGLGAVHGISQAIGGIAHVPHGVANSMMLPFVMEVNIKGAYKKYAKIAEVLGEKTQGLSEIDAAFKAVDAVKKMAVDLGIPAKLSQVNVTKDMFPTIIQGTMEYRLLRQNPIPYTPKIVEDMLEKAF